MNFETDNKIPLHEEAMCEMARVGFLGEGENLEIYIHTNDGGEIPHVHIRNKEPSGKTTNINLCVQLEKSEYFSHGKYNGSLNISQRKEFNKFMHQPHRQGKFNTNYEYAVFLWNDNNSNHEITLQKDKNDNVIIPDYTQIAPYKTDNPNRTPLHEEAMCEIATVNRKDHFKDFNCDEFKVVIKGPPREHLYKNKAHVHIFHKQDGWEIRMSMEGEYLGYVTLGNRDKTDTFSDIEKVFRKWLLRNCVQIPSITNYVHIQHMWNSINEDLEIDVKQVLEALKPRKILNRRKTESPYNSSMERYLAERAKNESAVYEMAYSKRKLEEWVIGQVDNIVENYILIHIAKHDPVYDTMPDVLSHWERELCVAMGVVVSKEAKCSRSAIIKMVYTVLIEYEELDRNTDVIRRKTWRKMKEECIDQNGPAYKAAVLSLMNNIGNIAELVGGIDQDAIDKFVSSI